jgi:hypothetical protein
VLYFYEEGCPRAGGRWPELYETVKKFEGQPVMFIAVNSGNSSKQVGSYCRGKGVSWPVIVDDDRSVEKQFGFEVSLKNIYQAVAILPSGEARRTGSDFDAAAQAAAQGAKWKVEPKEIPADMKAAWLAIELGSYSQAGPTIRKSLKATKPETKAAAEKLDGYVQEQITKLASEAEQQKSQGDSWEAYKLYKQITAQFNGFTLDESISKGLTALEKDEAVLAEKKAGSALEAAKKVGGKGNAAAVRRAKGMLEKLVSEHPDSDAAAEAQQILTQLPQ